jgi:hypothetical protein
VQLGPVETCGSRYSCVPSARKAIVVGGTSQADRGWMRLVREDLGAADLRTPIELRHRVVGRRARRARRGRCRRHDRALCVDDARRRGAASRPSMRSSSCTRATVPIFGLSTSYLGTASSAAPRRLRSARRGSGRQAVRLLAGERPSPITTPARAVVDWREVERFAMAILRGAGVRRRRVPRAEPWERQKGTLLVGSLIVAIETALIVAFLWNGYRRRQMPAAARDCGCGSSGCCPRFPSRSPRRRRRRIDAASTPRCSRSRTAAHPIGVALGWQ